ncbi:MAG: 5,10-methylenetetrahydrofolate reductase, partial [Cyanobacteria bacterium]|nr:5,10-methylenetetrahydrofolate reductase [Cyanobacteriota bacterium]
MACNASFPLLQDVLARGGFAITAEVTPPRGADLSHTLEAAGHLRGRVHAANVTD